ncbi:MAG: alcohol dehydrogenase catalytic domain-containing protein [Candidatus Kuenenia sp.]|nr:alcohol dehydrogenase catalytic domain-containing protein [Candidatus Kuenenia hertensis]
MISIRTLHHFQSLLFRFLSFIFNIFKKLHDSYTHHVKFNTREYQTNGSFESVHYEYTGNNTSGWTILRNGKKFVKLGTGFTLVKTVYCGICSTDLFRKHLPYPLPQIIGHEVVGVIDNIPVVSEINASHLARNDHPDKCPYCKGGMHIHCPDRLTLGINKLPGGFSPFFLAPVAAISEVPQEIGIKTACIVEPFAAALHAITITPPGNGDFVAILGPRRLGMLVIAALSCFRRQYGLHFTICGIVRHKHLEELCLLLGADTVINICDVAKTNLQQQFDIVFDTTGNPDGFELSLYLTRHIVHLKSTHGNKVMGMKHLSDMVVDEIALLPYKDTHLKFTWLTEKEKRKNSNIYVSPAVSDDFIIHAREVHPNAAFHRLSIDKAKEMIINDSDFFENSPVPRFDLAIVTNLDEADSVIRPVPSEEFSLIRPRGAILLADTNAVIQESLFSKALLERGVEIHTSRCGDFKLALDMLQANPEMTKTLEEKFITHCFLLEDIDKAFMIAKDSEQSIKVVIKINQDA